MIPERRLIWTTTLADGWRPIEPSLALTAILTFEPERGGTRDRSRILHKSGADARKHASMGFEEGWGTTIEQWARLVERPA